MEGSTDENSPVLLRHYRGHHKPITCVAFNPISHKLASSSTDKTVNLWNIYDKLRCYKFIGHSDEVNCVAWSNNGELMATAGKDKSIKLWVPTVRGKSTVLNALCNVRSVEFHPVGRRLVTACEDKSVKLWNIENQKFISSFLSHTNRVRCARFAPIGKLVASCSDDRTVKIFDTVSGDLVHSYVEHTHGFGLDIAWHPSSALLAVALSQKRIKIFDQRNHKLLQLYSCHSGAVNSIAFHPHGNLMITGSDDGSTKILDLVEGRPVYTLLGHDDAVTATAFTSDGEHFATGSRDKQIMVWRSNMHEYTSVSGSSGNNTTCNKTNFEDEQNENILDQSIMVDPRKAMGYKFEMDNYEVED